MDPTTRPELMPIAESYRRFAEREARGVSAVYTSWAHGVSEDAAVLSLLETLQPIKRQPNLVFAAARWHGAGTTFRSFRDVLMGEWPQVCHTILTRATQTNEAGRCAVLLPFLAALPQPLALLEVGAAAGLCLLPDRFSYRYDHGTALDPEDGVSDVVLHCQLGPDMPRPAMPRVTSSGRPSSWSGLWRRPTKATLSVSRRGGVVDRRAIRRRTPRGVGRSEG